jgi:hypothetical protein
VTPSSFSRFVNKNEQFVEKNRIRKLFKRREESKNGKNRIA